MTETPQPRLSEVVTAGEPRVELRRAQPNPAGYPKVQGECPACKCRSLFLGADGYVTCAIARCPDPCAASEGLRA